MHADLHATLATEDLEIARPRDQLGLVRHERPGAGGELGRERGETPAHALARVAHVVHHARAPRRGVGGGDRLW